MAIHNPQDFNKEISSAVFCPRSLQENRLAEGTRSRGKVLKNRLKLCFRNKYLILRNTLEFTAVQIIFCCYGNRRFITVTLRVNSTTVKYWNEHSRTTPSFNASNFKALKTEKCEQIHETSLPISWSTLFYSCLLPVPLTMCSQLCILYGQLLWNINWERTEFCLQGIALTFGPIWLGSAWRRRQNPVSQPSCF
jgi:hypothetical protein